MNFKKIAIALWKILDDIDTYSDIAKSDNIVYRKTVESRMQEHHKFITSDGYFLLDPKTNKRISE